MENKISKNDISTLVLKHNTFKNFLKVYNDKDSSAYSYTIQSDKEWNNGLLDRFFVIELGGEIVQIIVPIFSTEKTITWSLGYVKPIKETLEANGKKVDDEKIGKLIKVALFFLDKETTDLTFLAAIELNDWINEGNKGKNGHSVYFWNDRLPNQWCLTKKELEAEWFVKKLPGLSKKQIMQLCTEYATTYYTKFANANNRSVKTIITNIAKGLYAQIMVYLWYREEGYDVNLVWADGDDLGVDIIYNINGHAINIDVKSTRDEFLRISKNRKETDFYAVVKWNKTIPVMLGFLNKWDFWASKVVGTDAPEKVNEMYVRRLTKKYMKHLLKIDDLYECKREYDKLKRKRKEQLFELQ